MEILTLKSVFASIEVFTLRCKEKKKKNPIDAVTLSKAIRSIKENRFTIYGAAQHFKLPRTTIRRHYEHCLKTGSDVSSLHDNLAVKKVFTRTEEHGLVERMKEAADMHYGLTLKQVKKLAYQYAIENGKKYPPSWDTAQMAGDYWLRLFRKRYGDEIILRKPESSNQSCAPAFYKHNFWQTYESYKRALSMCPKDVKATEIWNVDETRLSLVVNSSEVASPSTAEADNVTMIAAVNAGGGFLPPMLIFPHDKFEEFMVNGAPDGTIGVANPTGDSNESIFTMFLQHFITIARPSIGRPVVLLLDNHDSHISIPVMQLAKDNGVLMVSIHPYTRHLMQPLDTYVFERFRVHYNTAANDLLMSSSRTEKMLTVYDVPALVGIAFQSTFVAENICQGFKATGFYPLNENTFSYLDFIGPAYSDRPNDKGSPPAVDDGTSAQPSTSDSQIFIPDCQFVGFDFPKYDSSSP